MFEAGSGTGSTPLITELLSWEEMLTTCTHTQTHVPLAFILESCGCCAWQRGKRHAESSCLSLSLPSIFHCRGCSLPPNAGLRSHYLPLISVAGSSGAVRDCLGRGEEGRRRNEAYGPEREHTPPNRTDRARDLAGFQVTPLQRKKNDNVCGSG